MANVLLTDYCNRGCAYCFARNKVELDAKDQPIGGTYLSLDDLDYVIQWFKRSRLTTFTALGGEPTLHPSFIEMADRVYASGLNLRVFSNGLISEEVLDYLSCVDPSKTGLIININQEDEYRPEQWEATLRTIERLSDITSLGFNIYRKEFQPGFLVDLTVRYDLRKILRIGLAQPIYGVQNAYIPVREYSDIAPKIVDLARMCSSHDIALDFDCGFTLCMFTEEQLGALYFSGTPFVFTCPTVVDIGPQLDVWHCFPLSTIMNTRLDEFADRSEVVQRYAQKLFHYRSLGAMDRCRTCEHLRRGFCSGGCISHNLAAFQRGVDDESSS